MCAKMAHVERVTVGFIAVALALAGTRFNCYC